MMDIVARAEMLAAENHEADRRRDARIRAIRMLLADHASETARLQCELQQLLAERGSRPPDGSDQRALFETDERLF